MKHQLVTFQKNDFTILVIHLKNIKFIYFKKFLLEKIQESPSFFKNIPIVLNIEKLSYTFDWINIKNFILSIGLFLIGITGCKNKNIEKMILKSGFLILSTQKKLKSKICTNQNFVNIEKEKSINTSFYNLNDQKNYVFNQLIRSGQRVYLPNTDLIITNNVSAGAELISDGHVHIYGMMRGRVLAGASGDITRKIFCTHLFAELISIAGEYLTIEQIPLKYLGKSVEISLINHILCIKNLI
ncbi:Septum site-determining protein MinC [Buchnera aphidicola (Cinara piceae)]|uniref:Probable septum site-determining protein MinC n=1 Tax=Buchnera aphidicola (Cinara piceae) TaxID=1660043 RepID=A0A803GCN8_9GAMM|nr:septum site-determining protein MinC [Buchnera aphidicola]VFP88368.1 Septum site-determining protein MinC [Buchnera aphidicola (Cinara piceae)]